MHLLKLLAADACGSGRCSPAALGSDVSAVSEPHDGPDGLSVMTSDTANSVNENVEVRNSLNLPEAGYTASKLEVSVPSNPTMLDAPTPSQLTEGVETPSVVDPCASAELLLLGLTSPTSRSKPGVKNEPKRFCSKSSYADADRNSEVAEPSSDSRLFRSTSESFSNAESELPAPPPPLLPLLAGSGDDPTAESGDPTADDPTAESGDPTADVPTAEMDETSGEAHSLPPIPGLDTEEPEGEPTLKIKITKMSSKGVRQEACKLVAPRSWTGSELKAAVETAIGTPALEQHLMVIPRSRKKQQRPDTRELHSPDSLESFPGKGAHFELVCDCPPKPEVAWWLGRVMKRGQSLSTASGTIRRNRDVALAAVQQNGRALQFVSESLRRDRLVVLAAVQQDGYSLRYASKDLQNDREVVIAAVEQNGLALNFASDRLVANDISLAVIATRQNGMALQFAGETVRSDPMAQSSAAPPHSEPHQALYQTLGSTKSSQMSSHAENGNMPCVDDGRWPFCPGFSKLSLLSQSKQSSKSRRNMRMRARRYSGGTDKTGSRLPSLMSTAPAPVGAD